MGLIVASIGGYAYKGISDIGDVVKDTYDRPLMAINFSRSASQVFSRLDNTVLKEAIRATAGEQPDFKNIETLIEAFQSDMDVVAQRSISVDAIEYIQETLILTTDWTNAALKIETLRDADKLAALEEKTEKIFENLDIIVELQANESFLSREETLLTVDKIRQYNTIMAITAFAFALLLAVWMSLTILRPLKIAVRIAQQVSNGDFNTAIPQGRRDETGQLLQSMMVMQNSIRNLVARERNEKTLAIGHLTAALANSKDAILIANAQGIIIVANAQISTMFPLFNPDVMIGQPLVKFFNYDGHPVSMSVESHMNDRASNTMRFQDGRWTLINASEMHEGGRLFIWTDITELKQREITLREAKEKAESANRAKTMFLASMSHELRTPLNAIIGFSHMIKNQTLGPIKPVKYSELSGYIYNSGHDLLRMVEDVLVVSGSENNMSEKLEFTRADIRELITAELKEIAPLCKTNNIGVLWHQPDNPCLMQCDVTRFSRVIRNILSNAVRFNREGGFIKVKLTTLDNEHMALDIVDSGIGIAPEDIERVMAPFVQVDNSHSRAYDGAGLGLTIARHFITLHGGELSIASKPGQGTAVRLKFKAEIKSIETPQPLLSPQQKIA